MTLNEYVDELGKRLDVSASVVDDYEAQVEDLTQRLNVAAADLLETRSQRAHLARQLAVAAEQAIEHAKRHAVILDEQVRELFQLTDQRDEARRERDEARDEVVRLGRELEQWKQAFGENGLRIATARLLDALGRSRRPWTDDEVTVKDDGMKVTTVAVKRACNGCGERLGDVTDEEMERAIAGLPAEDVRGECLTCTPLPSPEVSIDALAREVLRLRTIIGELGAAEAAEPPGPPWPQPQPWLDKDFWEPTTGACGTCGWERTAGHPCPKCSAQPEGQIEALRPEGGQ